MAPSNTWWGAPSTPTSTGTEDNESGFHLPTQPVQAPTEADYTTSRTPCRVPTKALDVADRVLIDPDTHKHVAWFLLHQETIKENHSSKEYSKQCFSNYCENCDRYYRRCMFTHSGRKVERCKWCSIVTSDYGHYNTFELGWHMWCNKPGQAQCGKAPQCLDPPAPPPPPPRRSGGNRHTAAMKQLPERDVLFQTKQSQGARKEYKKQNKGNQNATETGLENRMNSMNISRN